MTMRGRRDLAIKRGNIDTSFVPFRFELPPNVRGAGVETEDTAFHTVADGLQPCAKLGLALAFGQALDATLNLADGDGADIKFVLVLAKPFDDLGFRLGFDGFAVDVGIDEVTHSAGGSESSRSRAGISKVSGQASKRSTRP